MSGSTQSAIRERSTDPALWGWIYRNSLNEIPEADGEWILAQLQTTEPKLGPHDPEPGEEAGVEPELEETDAPTGKTTKHGPIQGMLVTLGETLGLKVWVASNDRSVVYEGKRLGDQSEEALPSGLPDDVRKRIGRIDVIWIRRNSYVAAFEVEATTDILSGLARMGDLLALVPNLDIPLFIVAPDERRGRVFEEIKRPLFTHGLEKPLHRRCRFIAFSTLESALEQFGDRVGFADPERFLDAIAEEAP